jgi:hypothetical protein
LKGFFAPMLIVTGDLTDLYNGESHYERNKAYDKQVKILINK